MSPSPSRLSDSPRPLVLDAGALVNLLATARPDEVLRSLERSVLIEPATLDRLDGAAFGWGPRSKAFHSLESHHLTAAQALGEKGYGIFLDLVGALPPDDLGDAQAAAVALASEVGGELVIDEPKAAHLAAERLDREPLHTLNLLASSVLARKFGPDDVARLLAAAAQGALIRVPSRFRPWAADLLRLDHAVLDMPTTRWLPLLAPGLRHPGTTASSSSPVRTGPGTRSKAKRR